MRLHPGGPRRHGSKGRKSEPGTRKGNVFLARPWVHKTWDESEISRTSRASCDDTHSFPFSPCLLTAVPQQCFATAAGQRFSPSSRNLSVALYPRSPQQSFVSSWER